MCSIVESTHADFIKTSTGYGSRGANFEDIELFKKYLKIPAKMKASGVSVLRKMRNDTAIRVQPPWNEKCGHYGRNESTAAILKNPGDYLC